MQDSWKADDGLILQALIGVFISSSGGYGNRKMANMFGVDSNVISSNPHIQDILCMCNRT